MKAGERYMQLSSFMVIAFVLIFLLGSMIEEEEKKDIHEEKVKIALVDYKESPAHKDFLKKQALKKALIEKQKLTKKKKAKPKKIKKAKKAAKLEIFINSPKSYKESKARRDFNRNKKKKNKPKPKTKKKDPLSPELKKLLGIDKVFKEKK